jgi:predicted house-cleaning noncanonical NTP pyrophosphatase (MazG superfamily)
MTQTHSLKIDKLIRDKIPEIMRVSGIEVFERVLENDEYLKRLKDKLVEEAKEVLSAGSKKEICEELADVLEVMLALLKIYGLEFEHIIQKAEQKRAERGRFENRTYIDSIKIKASHPNLSYYRSRPDKYPEVK